MKRLFCTDDRVGKRCENDKFCSKDKNERCQCNNKCEQLRCSVYSKNYFFCYLKLSLLFKVEFDILALKRLILNSWQKLYLYKLRTTVDLSVKNLAVEVKFRSYPPFKQELLTPAWFHSCIDY